MCLNRNKYMVMGKKTIKCNMACGNQVCILDT